MTGSDSNHSSEEEYFDADSTLLVGGGDEVSETNTYSLSAGDNGAIVTNSNTEPPSSQVFDPTSEATRMAIMGRMLAYLRNMGGVGEGEREEEETKEETQVPLMSASSHSYLPVEVDTTARQERLSNEDLFGAEMNIPLIPLRGVVLFPGESLPMRVFSAAHLASLDQLLTDFRNGSDMRTRVVIGVIHKPKSQHQTHQEWKMKGAVGTMTEVIGSKKQGGGYWGGDMEGSSHPELVLVSRGVSRFELLSEPVLLRGMWWGKIKPLRDDCPSSLCEMYPKPQRLLKRKRHARSTPCMTHSPAWMFHLYDAEHLKQQINKLLADLELSLNISPRLNLTEFSFSVASSLPVGDKQRNDLLSCLSVTARLRLIHETLAESKRLNSQGLFCRNCGTKIASKRDVFSVPGADGVVGAYVNPHGVIHQTITLKNAENLLLDGQAVAEDSWFPGYSWTIAYCSCYNHMGWLFTRNTRQQPVSFFWGVRRSELVDKENRPEQTEEEEEEEDGSDEYETEDENEDEEEEIQFVSTRDVD